MSNWRENFLFFVLHIIQFHFFFLFIIPSVVPIFLFITNILIFSSFQIPFLLFQSLTFFLIFCLLLLSPSFITAIPLLLFISKFGSRFFPHFEKERTKKKKNKKNKVSILSYLCLPFFRYFSTLLSKSNEKRSKG